MSAVFVGDCEVLESLGMTTYGELVLARRPDGTLIEMIAMEPLVDDIAEAEFRGAVVPRWREITALDDARLPRLLAEPLRVDGRNVAHFAHEPFVAKPRIVGRARVEHGLAFPLVCSIGRDVAEVLRKLHDHNFAGFGFAGVGVDGRVHLVEHHDPSPSTDVRQLGRMLAQLAFGAGVRRDDLPVRFTALLDWMIVEHNDPPPASIVSDELEHDDLEWTKWTREQVVAELRALFPDLESRR